MIRRTIAICALFLSTSNAVADWSYSEKQDELRGTKSKYAVLVSDNKAEFEFPYDGGSYMGLIVRKTAKKYQPHFSIQKGQFECSDGDNGGQCYVVARFDRGVKKGKLLNILLSQNERRTPNILMVDSLYNAVFIEELRRSTKLTIEFPFHIIGNRQFVFTLRGFKM